MSASPPTVDPFTFLLGSWSLQRDIPGHATATGHATVALLDAGSARYEEHVTLYLPGETRLPGSAAYFFRRQAPASLDVLFARSGELFQHLAFAPDAEAALTAQATHLCSLDRYDSTWRILPSGTVTVTHHVSGPRKRYTSYTLLTRLA